MKKSCILFCGQGSQVPGMGRALCENFASARRVFECGGDILGFDLKKTCFEGDAAALAPTGVAQPAIFAVSLAGFCVLTEELGVAPSAVAGHSLGEYGALTAAGVFTLEDGFRVIRARAAAMEAAAAQSDGAMAAVIGSDEGTVERVCGETPGLVRAVSYNAPKQTVIAGERAAVDAASARFQGMGLRVSPLAVSGAFHTPLMQGAADALAQAVRDIPACAPRIPFYANVTGGRMDSFYDLPGYLREHMVSPVRFTRELGALAADGCALFLEVGPGKVLSGLVKRTLEGTVAVPLEDGKNLEKIRAALQ